MKYCCQPGFENFKNIESSENVPTFYLRTIKNFCLTLLLTFSLELSIFWILGIRKRRTVFGVGIANIISVVAFFLLSFWFSGIIFVFLSELAIIIFESIFLGALLRGINIKKIIFATIVANFVLGIIGGFLIGFLL